MTVIVVIAALMWIFAHIYPKIYQYLYIDE
jgi:hypothetical protein